MDSFWDFFWFIIISYVFIAYLMMLFNIIGDIFRDRGLSGGGKALWCILLILVPWLGALAVAGGIVYGVIRLARAIVRSGPTAGAQEEGPTASDG